MLLRKEPKNDAERGLLEFLRQQRSFYDEIWKNVLGAEHMRARLDYLLEHGYFFDPQPILPKGFRKLPNKMCYKNAGTLALHGNGGKTLTYVEGYATSVIPCGHAWVTNGDGKADRPDLDQA